MTNEFAAHSDEQAEEHRKVYVHFDAFNTVFAEAKDEDQWQYGKKIYANGPTSSSSVL